MQRGDSRWSSQCSHTTKTPASPRHGIVDLLTGSPRDPNEPKEAEGNQKKPRGAKGNKRETHERPKRNQREPTGAPGHERQPKEASGRPRATKGNRRATKRTRGNQREPKEDTRQVCVNILSIGLGWTARRNSKGHEDRKHHVCCWLML